MNQKAHRKGLLGELTFFGELTPGTRYRFVTRHLLADEKELLERFDTRPEECISCVVWWLYKGRLFSFTVESAHAGGVWSEPVVSYRRCLRKSAQSNYDAPDSFVVLTNKVPLTTDMIICALDYLSSWIQLHSKVVFGRAEFHEEVLLRGDLFARK